MGKVIGRFRHWKQRFHKDARMQFRRPMMVDKQYKAGDEVPKEILGPRKLKRWWRAGVIELLHIETIDNETPPPQADQEKEDNSSLFNPEDAEMSHQSTEDQVPTPATEPEKIEVSCTHTGGGYYNIVAGDIKERVRGKAIAQKRVEELESSSGQTLHLSDTVP